jgi:hypothetical protein
MECTYGGKGVSIILDCSLVDECDSRRVVLPPVEIIQEFAYHGLPDIPAVAAAAA